MEFAIVSHTAEHSNAKREGGKLQPALLAGVLAVSGI